MNEEAVRGARDLAQARKAAQAAANCDRFPFAARLVSELRRYFPGVKVRYARENGFEVGKRLE